LFAVFLQAVSARHVGNKRAPGLMEVQIAADLRGAREERMVEAHAIKAGMDASKASAEHGKSESRLSRWVQEVQSVAGPFGSPVLAVIRERLRARQIPVEPAQEGGENHLAPEGKKQRMTAGVIAWLVSESIYLILCLLVAYLYKTHKDWFMDQTLKDPSEKDFKKFTSPVLEPVLLWSCLCPGVRWADSMSMAGIIGGYWTAFALFFLMCLVTGLSFGLPGWILMTIFMVYFRMRLRTKFEMEPSLLTDFCCYCWCLPCVVAQEARHIEEAKSTGNMP